MSRFGSSYLWLGPKLRMLSKLRMSICNASKLRSSNSKIKASKLRIFFKANTRREALQEISSPFFIHQCSKGCLFQPQIDEIVSKLRSKLRIVSSKLRMPVFVFEHSPIQIQACIP